MRERSLLLKHMKNGKPVRKLWAELNALIESLSLPSPSTAGEEMKQ